MTFKFLHKHSFEIALKAGVISGAGIPAGGRMMWPRETLFEQPK